MEFIVARDSAASPLSARERFASQVRHLRAQKGFATARSFARALGIEENRYTRYERAESDPSLTLIPNMCEILGVSPNELLGFHDVLDLPAMQRVTVYAAVLTASGGDMLRLEEMALEYRTLRAGLDG